MKATIAALISAAVITPVVAQTATPGVDKSTPVQQTTKVAPKETAKVEAPQAKVEAKADKKVTPKERAKLAKAKKKQTRNVPKAS
jgi:hypothetical protein